MTSQTGAPSLSVLFQRARNVRRRDAVIEILEREDSDEAQEAAEELRRLGGSGQAQDGPSRT